MKVASMPARLTLDDVAKLHRVTRSKVREWVKAGKLWPVLNAGCHDIFFDPRTMYTKPVPPAPRIALSKNWRLIK